VYISRFSRILASVLAVCLVALFVLAVPFLHASASGAHSNVASQAAASTSCPAPGTARAASLPSLKLGAHQTIVYIVNEGSPNPTFGTLKRYDVVTGAKVEIVKMPGTIISEAQVSADGQWVLFVANASGQGKLQLIRMDGQFLQTLYCGSPSQVQWSTNQRLIVFADGNNTDLLNTTNGALQIELTSRINPVVHPRTWLDNTRVLVTLQYVDGPPESVAILDTTKGPNQNVHKLQIAFDATSSTPFCWDFDSSYDGRKLFTSQCTASSSVPGPGADVFAGPSVISAYIAGSPVSYSFVYVNQGQAFTGVRAVTSNTLLFTVSSTKGNTGQNGLWKVGTNGSNPLHLAPSGAFNQFTQFPWSNVSRDNSKYALQIVNVSPSASTYTLEYGSLSGGAPVVFASINNVQLALVGWTTM
jgi:eukaryotic-like serine/threonine-protein kinase